MRRIALVAGLLLLPTLGLSQEAKVGAVGAQFLKIGVGSRYLALGDAAVAHVNDVYSMYWNPAGLARVEHAEASFTNVNWVLDVSLNYVAVARTLEDLGTFGLSAAVMSVGDQEITTFEQQDGTGRFYSAASYAVGVSFARQLTDKFAFGATVKYVGEEIHLDRASGWAFDFGTMLETGFRSLRLGMSITNMGSQLSFSGPGLDVTYDPLDENDANADLDASLKTTPYSLPLTFRVGVAYDFLLSNDAIATMTADLKHPNDNIQQGSFGLEVTFQEQFFLRGGYKLNYDEENLTLGGGVQTTVAGDTRLAVDYAWSDLGRLTSAHRFSVGFLF